MTDGTGSHSYTYGNLDELLSTTTTYTGLAAKTISYAYYPNGSRQTMTTPAGTFSYNYDAAGRPSSMNNPFSETTSWAYLNNDWLQSQTLANGATANYTYNAMGQVTRLLNQLGGNTLSDFSSIGYDGAGNRNSVTASIPGATLLNGTTGYSYDSKDQLTQETSTRNGGFTDNFGYDSAGNPTSFKGVTKTYNSNNQQTASGFAHDGNGNPTTYNGTTLAFDPENRMTAYGTVLTAGYTGDGLRAWKQNVSGRTYFLYDGILPVVELDSSGAVTAANTKSEGGVVSSRRFGSASVFYGFDSEGNATHRSDASGTILSNNFFGAHGNVLTGMLIEPFGYKAEFGYYTDNESGLLLLTHRYYDPNAGRFLTRDPIGYDGGVNLYGYVTNNPTGLVDPLGLQGRADGRWTPQETAAAQRQAGKGRCGCESQPANPLLLAGAVAVADGPQPGLTDLVAVGLLITALVSSQPVANCSPDNVIPFPTPKPSPVRPPPPPPTKPSRPGDECYRKLGICLKFAGTDPKKSAACQSQFVECMKRKGLPDLWP